MDPTKRVPVAQCQGCGEFFPLKDTEETCGAACDALAAVNGETERAQFYKTAETHKVDQLPDIKGIDKSAWRVKQETEDAVRLTLADRMAPPLTVRFRREE